MSCKKFRIIGERVSRRLLFGLFIFLAGAHVEGIAAADELTKYQSKAMAWLVGDALSFAAVQDSRGENIDKSMERAKTAAQFLGIEVKPLPPRAKTAGETLAAMTNYFDKGDGAAIEAALVTKYDQRRGKLFRLAWRCNLLTAAYKPGQDADLAQDVKSTLEEAGVPEKAWGGFVKAWTRKATFKEVNRVEVQMKYDVVQFFLTDDPDGRE